jgi:dimethylaniline monooxygenase (N-oxide forming)
VAAKELKEEGHEVVVYERTSGPGGVWAASKARGGVAWGSTITSSGALNSTLSDSVTEVFHQENAPFTHHLDRQQFLDLLTSYESRHQVFDGSLRCNVEVETMTRLGDDRWRLRVRNTSSGVQADEVFDAVTICTGLNKEPFTPAIEGQDRFLGLQMHAEEYRPGDVERFAGRRVLVVGLGETSSDVVKDLVDIGAEHVDVSQRGGTWVIPRNIGSVPADHVETRLVHDGPMLHRWAMLLAGVAPYALFPLVRPSRSRPPKPAHVGRILVRNHPRKWLLWRLGSLNWTKSDNIYFALDTGRATVRRDIERFEEGSVVFADGEERPIDAVIYCTGYRPGESLLPPVGDDSGRSSGGTLPRSARELYKLTIPPDQPNVAVIGFARGQIGALTLSAELQARWWALIVSGKRRLPPAGEMASHADSLRHHGRRFHQPTRTTPCFAYSLAREDIGCEPDLFELFRTDRRLWFAVLMGTVCAAHFRLRGPHAKPDVARAQLMMPQAVQSDDYIDSADLLSSTLPLAALVIPLYGAYSRVLPGFNARNATRSYI